MDISPCRRQLLAGLGLVAVAGCLGTDEEPSSGTDDGTNGVDNRSLGTDSFSWNRSRNGSAENEVAAEPTENRTRIADLIDEYDAEEVENDDQNSNADDPFGDIEWPECTRARVTTFDWDSQLFGDDAFRATVINRADIAGTVGVTIDFWQSSDRQSRQGSVSRSVSIGAQATEQVTIRASPPTSETDYATMSVTEQECR